MIELLKKVKEGLTNITATSNIEDLKGAVMKDLDATINKATTMVSEHDKIITELNNKIKTLTSERDEANSLLEGNGDKGNNTNKSATDKLNEFMGGVQ